MQLVDDGTSLLRQRQFLEAHAAFSAASDLAPIPAALDGQGCVALLEGDFERAEGLFQAALDLDGSYSEALANLALLKDLSGDNEKALEMYNQYLTGAPESGAVRNNKAALEYERGGGTISAAREMAKAGLLSDREVIQSNIRTLRRELSHNHGESEQQGSRNIGGTRARAFSTRSVRR